MPEGTGLWTLIGFLGAVQALAVGLALLTTREVRRQLFGLLVALLGVAMGVITVSHLPLGTGSLGLELVEEVVSIWAPVLFYQFVVLACRGGSTFGGLRLHFVLPALFTVYGVGLLLAGGLTRDRLPGIRWIVLFQVAYTLLASWRAGRGLRSPLAPGVVASEVRLARFTVALFWLLHLAQLVRFVHPAPAWRDIVPITSAFVAFTVTFLAARESRVFAGAAAGAGDSPAPKYRSSNLTEDQAERGLARLRRAMESERVFLRSDLTLTELAAELGLPRNQLSQIVNERCGLTFTDYLNSFRVAEAERLMNEPALAHVTVDAVGDRSGFNSRSAFYSAFKRKTGLTPAAFRRRREEL